MPRPKTGQTRQRNIRVNDELWSAALAQAEREGTSVPDWVRTGLKRKTRTLPEGAPQCDPWDVVSHVMKGLLGGKVGPETDLPSAVDAAGDLLRALGVAPTVKGDR